MPGSERKVEEFIYFALATWNGSKGEGTTCMAHLGTWKTECCVPLWGCYWWKQRGRIKFSMHRCLGIYPSHLLPAPGSFPSPPSPPTPSTPRLPPVPSLTYQVWWWSCGTAVFCGSIHRMATCATGSRFITVEESIQSWIGLGWKLGIYKCLPIVIFFSLTHTYLKWKPKTFLFLLCIF